MDSTRFDGLVRHFSQVRSRRQTLRGLAAIAASGGLALGGRAVSADVCKGNGKPCKKNTQCCSGNCVAGTGGVVKDGTCQPAGCANPQDPCLSTGFNCGPTNSCVCNAVPGGGTACGGGGFCGACADCGPGTHCVVAPCCPTGTGCVADCAESAVSARRVAGEGGRLNRAAGR